MRIENDPKSSVFNAISSTHVTEEKGTGAPVTHDESSESKKSVEHHPDDDIETGNMIVVELKHELRSRGLAVTGRKAELQERLSAHLDATREKRRLAAVRDNKIEACSSQSKGCDPSDSSSMSDNEARRMSVDIVEAVDNEKSTSAPFVPVNETTLKEDATSMSIDVTNDEAPEYDLQSTKSEATHFFDSMENNEGQITPIEEAVAMDVVKADDEQRVEAELANAQINNDNREELKQERAINKSPPNKMMNVIMKPISNMFSPRPTKKASNLIKGFKSNQQIFNGKEDLTSLHSTTKTKTSGSVSNKSFGSSRSSVASVISASSASSCASTSYQSAANSSEFKKSSAKKDFMGSSTTTKSDWQTSIDDKAKSSAIKLSQAKSALSVKLTTESAYERAAKQKARLEAMRGKARNEVLSASAVKEISATSKSVAKQAKEMLVTSSKKPGVSGNSRLPSATKTAALASLASTSEKTEKHRRLIAQMRERAQEKFQGPKKHTHAKVKDQLQESGGNSNKMIEESQRDQPQEINTQSKMKTKFRSPVRSLKKKSQSARSPMDTYEMSDREGSDSESDSDSDSEDEAKPKKRVCMRNFLFTVHLDFLIFIFSFIIYLLQNRSPTGHEVLILWQR